MGLCSVEGFPGRAWPSAGALLLGLSLVVGCAEGSEDVGSGGADEEMGDSSGDTAALPPWEEQAPAPPEDECQKGNGNEDCPEGEVCVGWNLSDRDVGHWVCRNRCVTCEETYPDLNCGNTGVLYERQYWCDDDEDCCSDDPRGVGSCNVALGHCETDAFCSPPWE